MTAAVPLSRFVERLLTGGTLEDKLWAPPITLDVGAAWAPEGPGRDGALAFAPRGANAPLPKRSQLDQPEARGTLLHSFANHELLAIELMALVLARFPEAPAGFRAGLLQVLRDEQRHLRLYLDRLESLGVVFGSLPLSSFFWDTCAAAPSPHDFLARMSLVFEQANLDFARTFGRWFAEVGDADSAAILDQVYTDEIRHVRHGLAWHRKWKAPDHSDWSAWVARLQQPLGPSRARGLGFDPAHRRAVGFDEDFVERLGRWRRSRGRPPVVHLLNSTCELALAGGGIPKRLLHLEADLSLLFALVAKAEDVVLTPAPPSVAWTEAWLAAGLELPQILPTPTDGLSLEGLGHTRIHGVEPWAWTPDLRRRVAPLLAEAVGPSRPSAQPGRFRKDWSLPTRRQLVSELFAAFPDAIAPPDTLGVTVADEAGVQAAVAAARGTVVLKAPLGTAGRGALRLDGWPPSAAQLGWIRRTLRQQGALVVEPWLSRVADLSLHLQLDPDGRDRALGVVPFLADGAGRFVGAWVGGGLRPLPTACRRLLTRDGRAPRWLTDVAQATLRHVGGALTEAGHTGPVGVDMLIYTDASGALRLQPAVEVNPRWTMGRFALEASRLVHPRSQGLLRVLPTRRWGPTPSDALAALQARWPQTRQSRQLVNGVISITDPTTSHGHLVILAAGTASEGLSKEITAST